MSAEIVELIVQLKDLFSEGYEKLNAMMETLPQKEQNVNAKLNQVRSQANEFYAKLTNDRILLAEIEKEKNLKTLYGYYKEGLISAEQYSAGVKAVNTQAMAAMAEPTLFDNIKSHWIALTATIIAAWQGVSMAMEYINIGAKALQSEESFKTVTASFEIDGDKLLAKMKDVSAGMIDESALMQRAVAALQQGLNPDQIVSLLEVARVAARTSGKDMIEAFDGITQAAATQMTKGLKAYNIVIDQAKAYEDYAAKIGVSKDALNEQQQSQALANAVIEEGHRQMKTLSTATMDAAEQLQLHKARVEELKESIGKGLIQVLGVTVENLDGVAVALTAAAIINAPAVFAKIEASLIATTASSGAASMAIKSLGVGLAAFLGYEIGDALAKVIWGINDIEERTTKLTGELARKTSTLNAELALLGFTGKDAWEKYELALKTGMVVTDAATGKVQNLLENLKQSITLMQAQIQTLQATSQFEMELVKRDYESGKITMDEYLAFIKDRQKKVTDAQIAEAQKRVEETKKEYQMKMISEDEMNARITVINEQIAQLRIKAARDSQAAYDQLNRESVDKAKKAEEDKFEAWKSLENLRLEAMKRQFALEDVIDEESYKNGEIRQSEFLERKLERLKDSYDIEIRLAEETIKKIEAENAAKTTLTDADILRYKTAIEEKEKLQDELQVNIIKSESEIGQVREAEWQKARADTEKYYDEIEKRDRENTAQFIKELHERTEQLNLAIDIITDRRRRLEATLSSMLTDNFDDVTQYFGNWKRALSTDVDDMQQNIDQFMRHTTMVGYDTFWNATLYGRRLIEMTGTTIYEWASRVADYINYVKSKMAELDDTITGLRRELMEMRGDRLGELELDYQDRKNKIEEQFKDLKGTKEYYEALALLDEWYKEKKKQLLEDMSQDQSNYDQEITKRISSPAGVGGGATGTTGMGTVGGGFTMPDIAGMQEKFTQGITESMQYFNSMMTGVLGEEFTTIPKEIVVKKEGKLELVVDASSPDVETTRRYINEILGPQLLDWLRMRGIDIVSTG